MRKEQFVLGHFYHIYNRGVEKRNVFLNDRDYWRFLQALLLFNDKNSSAHIISELEKRNQSPTLKTISELGSERNPLVRILCYSLMPNHYHLLIEEIGDKGISTFMHKLGTGYTNYFNIKNERVGSLFQGKFKVILIKDEEYLTHLSRYIHLNPVELVEPNWEIEGIKNWEEVNKYLENYKWSSYPDYLGFRNSKIIEKGILGRLFSRPGEYKKFVNSWFFKDLEFIKPIILEKQGRLRADFRAEL